MATRDSGDSNLPKEPGNEVCDISKFSAPNIAFLAF